MKKALILMLGLVASTASFADSNPSTPASTLAQTRVRMTKEHKIKLYVQPLATKGRLAIQDATGQPVYTETIALQKGLYQQFDFSNLSTGTYRLTLTAGQETFTKTFVVQTAPNESFVMQ